jgi:hypothetical protein
VWGLITAALVVGILVGAVAPTLMAPQAVARLQQASGDDTTFPFDWYYVIDEDSLIPYDSFGAVDVWSGVNQQGVPCLLVAVGRESLTSGCAPGELDPTIDLNFSDRVPPVNGLELAPGSVVRFVLHDGVVGVWIAEAPEPSPVSS